MTIKEFMQKTGVSKKVYVENWIREGLIPGVLKDEKTGELIFPSSARRPYKPRFKSDANASTVRASILNACLKREYISSKIYSMSEGEFLSFVNDLKVAGLIQERVEDGITYYDSTAKSDIYRKESFNKIKNFVIDCIGVVSEKAVYGATKASLETFIVA